MGNCARFEVVAEDVEGVRQACHVAPNGDVLRLAASNLTDTAGGNDSMISLYRKSGI